MNKFLILISFCISSFAVADGHGNLGLEKRQPDAAMNVTSVTLGQDLSTISAEGDMEGYGKVYATYHLTYDVERTSGIVEGQGRGFTAEGYASGRFQGIWELVEGVIVMRNVVSINNGTMNLDVIEFNPLTRSLIVQAYILKWSVGYQDDIRLEVGFTGDLFISGAIGDGAEWDAAEEVEAYIKERVPAE